MSKYSYYSIINSYKNIFKNENNEYKDGVTFDEIFSLYEFDKNLKKWRKGGGFFLNSLKRIKKSKNVF